MTKRALTLLAFVAIALSGCMQFQRKPASEGVTLYAWIVEKTYSTDVLTTYAAALSALRDADVDVYLKRADATSGRIEGSLAGGKRLRISLHVTEDNRTRVSIRAGFFGDRDISLFLLERIRERLG